LAGKKMLPEFDPAAVEEALRRFDAEVRPRGDDWLHDQRQKYAVSANGRLYPPKQIVRMIAGQTRSSFPSKEARRRLRGSGFEVVELPREGTDGWKTFLYWGKRFTESDDFLDSERAYKIQVADNVAAAKGAMLRGDPGWLDLLRKAFGPPNNLTPWLIHDRFWKWCADHQDAALELLRKFWLSEEPLEQRLDAFASDLPSGLITRALRVTLGSFLLTAEDVENLPVYRDVPFTRGYRITGFPSHGSEATTGEIYGNALDFLDRLIEEAESEGLLLEDRLQAQGVVWGVTNNSLDYGEFAQWSKADREALRRLRGEREDHTLWWVNQGSTFNQESHGGYVWAPLRNQAGTVLSHHANVSRLRTGHKLLHYANGVIRAIGTVVEDAREAPRPQELPAGLWESSGRMARVEYSFLEKPIELNEIPVEWRIEEQNPFHSTGGVRQGYMFPLSEDFCRRLQERFPGPLDGLLEGTQVAPEEVLVGAIGSPENADLVLRGMNEILAKHGEEADWWSHPVQPDHGEVLKKHPYLYLYVSAPVGKVMYRLKVEEFVTSTGNEGLETPWLDITPSEHVGLRRRGSQMSDVFRTWFRFSDIEELETPIDPSAMERSNGGEAAPNTLLGGFGVWRRKRAAVASEQAASLEDLALATNMALTDMAELDELLEEKKQIVIEGPPGSGKTYLARLLARYFTGIALDSDSDEQVRVVQFHQSYGYEEFIQGIRPESRDGAIQYHLRAGVFKDFCTTATANSERRFVMIIDEINRGNISRIFGELLYLLEYRDQKVRLANSAPDDEPFVIPENVYLIGTMNTTDRSLALIDYALRRRFYFWRLMPVEDGRAPILESWLAKREVPVADRNRIVGLFLALNRRISQDIGEHFQVGHSYFMRPDIHEQPTLQQVWRRAVMPLLEEYYHNRRNLSEVLEGFQIERMMTTNADSPD
jgi:hypothetical protein